MKNQEVKISPAQSDLFTIPVDLEVVAPDIEIVSPDTDFLNHHKRLAAAGEISQGQARRIKDYLERLQSDDLSDITPKESKNLGNLHPVNRIADYYLSLGPTSKLKGFDHTARLFQAVPRLLGENPRTVFTKIERGQYVPQDPRAAALAGLMFYEAAQHGKADKRDDYGSVASGILSAVRQRYAETRITDIDEDKLKKEQGIFTDALAEDAVKKALYNISFDRLSEDADPEHRKHLLEERVRKILLNDAEKEPATGFKYELIVFALANLIIARSGRDQDFRVHFATPRQDSSSVNSGFGNHKFNHDLIVQQHDGEGWHDVQRVDIKAFSKKVQGKHPSISLLQSEQDGNSIRSLLEDAQMHMFDGSISKALEEQLKLVKTAQFGESGTLKVIIDLTKMEFQHK